MIDDLVGSALLLAVPLVIAGMGGVVNRLGGVVNIGLEGQMLVGALVGAVTSGAVGGSFRGGGAALGWVAGVLAACAAGALVGLAMTLLITRLRANEIVVGLGLNIVVAGVIGYVLRGVLGVSGTLRVPGLVPLPDLAVPGVDRVPVLGAAVGHTDPLFWFAVLLVPLVGFTVRRTPWGLRLRATGAAEDAARSLGLATLRIRDASGVIAGALAGIAGAHLSLGQVGVFNEHMVAGRGYIAMAAYYFGRSRPWPTAAACLIFAFFDALQFRLQSAALPAQLVQTLPYVVVVAVLAATGIRRTRHGARAARTKAARAETTQA